MTFPKFSTISLQSSNPSVQWFPCFLSSSSSPLYSSHTHLHLSLIPPPINLPLSWPSKPLSTAIKTSLDPENLYLSSWSSDAADPCDSSFEGIACDGLGQVVNISLQGKGLAGEIPPTIGELKSLSGLHLHFNQLRGEVTKEIVNMGELADLYLNVNNLTGEVPSKIGKMI